MTVTIQGRVFGSPTFGTQENPTRVTVRIFARDPDNPFWLLDAHAHADGPLAGKLAECPHGAMVTATGVLTRTAPLPEERGAGNTSASLALTDVTIAP